MLFLFCNDVATRAAMRGWSAYTLFTPSTQLSGDVCCVVSDNLPIGSSHRVHSQCASYDGWNDHGLRASCAGRLDCAEETHEKR